MIKPIFIILTLAGFASGAEFEVTDKLSVVSTAVFSGNVGVAGSLYVNRDFALPTGTFSNFPAASGGNAGHLRYASDQGKMYYSNGIAWIDVIEQSPKVDSVSPSLLPPGQDTAITINGSNFKQGAAVRFGSVTSASVTFNSASQLFAQTGTGLTSGAYNVTVTNPSGLENYLFNGLTVNSPPVWTTPAGSLGTFRKLIAVSTGVAATDPEGQTITYSVVNGALPPGLSLSTTTGIISGTPDDVVSDTTSTFTIRAADSVSPPGTSDREFRITIRNPVASAFSYTGSDQSWTVPNGVSSAFVKLWGAGGSSGPGGSGGGGGFASGTLIVASGETITVIVGGAGGNAFNAYGGGGTQNGSGGNGRGGGGRSAIRRGSTELATAGAGGGCGYSSHNGGAAGGLTGQQGNDGSFSTSQNSGAGGGGGQTQGGEGGQASYNGYPGTQFTGGNGGNLNCGGGGGGWYGGGGGGPTASDGAGGGGSSYTGGLTGTVTNTAGSSSTGANQSDPDHAANTGSQNQNGYVVIIW